VPSLYWWNSKEIDGKDFLTLETLNLNFWSFLFPSLGIGMKSIN
jgi:hypothetical protein